MSLSFSHQRPPSSSPQQLLDLHNQLRRRVAKGEEGVQVRWPLHQVQPGAADMLELVWNDELAGIAQGWADQCDCVFQESTVSGRTLPRYTGACV